MIRIFTWCSALMIGCILAACGGSGATYRPDCTIEINADSVMSNAVRPQPASAVLQKLRPAWGIDDRAVTGLDIMDLMNGYTYAYAGAPIAAIGPQSPFVQAPHLSRVVILELGGNDAYGSLPPDQYEDQLTKAIVYLQSIGKTVVLTGIIQTETWGAFDIATGERIQVLDAITRKLAAKFGLHHAGWHSVAPQTVDGVHPTSERLAMLMERLVIAVDTVTDPACRVAQGGAF